MTLYNAIIGAFVVTTMVLLLVVWLQRIAINDAHDDGYRDGQEDGYKIGYSEGHKAGQESVVDKFAVAIGEGAVEAIVEGHYG